LWRQWVSVEVFVVGRSELMEDRLRKQALLNLEWVMRFSGHAS
jgi:hypothetical protein